MQEDVRSGKASGKAPPFKDNTLLPIQRLNGLCCCSAAAAANDKQTLRAVGKKKKMKSLHNMPHVFGSTVFCSVPFAMTSSRLQAMESLGEEGLPSVDWGCLEDLIRVNALAL